MLRHVTDTWSVLEAFVHLVMMVVLYINQEVYVECLTA